MQFKADLKKLRGACAMRGSLNEDEPEWRSIAAAARHVAAQIPGVDPDAVVESIRVDLPRTWQEQMMPLDRVVVGAVHAAAMHSQSRDKAAYATAAGEVYDDVKRSLNPR